jgi:pSer/pThr/pTyr-binding forkhead associated (FHA) protein
MQVAPARGASHTVYSEEAEAVRLMGFLSVVLSSHDDEGAYFRLQKGVNEIGQFQTGAAVGLRDPEVSSSHALIVCTDSAIRYIDLDSTNGSLINGERTEYAELEAGDVLELGRTLLAFVPFPFLAED